MTFAGAMSPMKFMPHRSDQLHRRLIGMQPYRSIVPSMQLVS